MNSSHADPESNAHTSRASDNRWPCSLVLENISRIFFDCRSALRLDAPWRGRPGWLCGVASAGISPGEAKAGSEYLTAGPFLVSPTCLGIWSPEGRNIRLTVFDLDQLEAFDLAEIAGWFKQSSDRIYSKTTPLADFEVSLNLTPGLHKIDVPPRLATVDELIVPTSYKALSSDEPAFALFVLYLQAGLVEVLPQKWFTAAQYQVGKQWISRAARDQESHRIFGECFGVGTFVLEEDGCRLAEWMDKKS